MQIVGKMIEAPLMNVNPRIFEEILILEDLLHKNGALCHLGYVPKDPKKTTPNYITPSFQLPI